MNKQRHTFLCALALIAAACRSSTAGLTNAAATNLAAPPANFSADLPCDVALILSTHCQSCHQGSGVGGAPMALVTAADLSAKSPIDLTKTQGQRSLFRMQSTSAPMPPGQHLAQSDIDAFAAWINGGQRAGTCGDGSVSIPGAAVGLVCTSGTYWHNGTRGSKQMEPGDACIACHFASRGEAPSFVVAGTVYPTVREPDNCNGLSPAGHQVSVVVTDATGKQVAMTPNAVGNFYLQGSLKFPLNAELHVDATITQMQRTIDTGDCNSCHTPDGVNGAPGRIH